MNVVSIKVHSECQKRNNIEMFYACKVTGMVCKNECMACCGGCDKFETFGTIEEAFDAGYKPCIRCQSGYRESKGNKEQIIYCAKKEIEMNYQKKFSLTQLADKVYVNQDYLGRIFKEIVGETPLRYHHFVRCEHARQILENPEVSIEIAAYKAGYVSTSHFIKLFKANYGITPLQYQKKNENTNSL